MRYLIVLALSLLVFLAGCETFRGMGKDMQRAGKWVEREAAK